MAENNQNFALIALVAIVAVVGIVGLFVVQASKVQPAAVPTVSGSGAAQSTMVYDDEGNFVGEAFVSYAENWKCNCAGGSTCNDRSASCNCCYNRETLSLR